MVLYPVKHSFVASFFACLCVCLCLAISAKGQQKADFAASVTSDCESVITTFTDQSTGSPVAWQWDFGNGNTATKQNPAATYVQTGNYTVTLKVTYADGSTQTVTKADYIHVRSKPKVDFVVSANKGCAPFATSFTDKSQPGDGTLQSFSWDFGDGGVALNAGSTANYTYTVPGIYNVILTVTNSYGCTNFKTMEKAVDVAPAIQADFTVTDKMLCKAPVDVLFQNTSTGPGTLSYKWEFDDGSTSTLKDLGKHTFTTKGTHQIKLTVTNERGCTGTKTVNDINVANYATTLTVPTLACSGQSSDYRAVFSPVQPQSTIWEFNGSPYWSNADYATYYNGAAGPLTVKVTAQYGNCTDVVTKTVDVKQSPTIQPVTDNKLICNVPATVDFKANSTGAIAWKWDFNDGGTATTADATHVYNQEGYFDVTLLATSKDGCSISNSLRLDIRKTEVRIYAAMTNGCENLSTNFYAYTSTGDEVKTYLWHFGDGTTSTEATPTHEYAKAGFYTISMDYVTANGCSGTAYLTDKVAVYKKPAPDFSSPDAPEVCGNTPATFINKSDVGTDWYWEFGDGGYASGNTVTHSYSEPGTYDVTLVVSNETCHNRITKKAYITAVNPFPRFDINPVDCSKRTTVSVTEHSLGATSWKWSWGDGKETSYTTHSDIVTHQYDKSGTYTIQLTTSDGHCTTHTSHTVTIIALSPVVITTNKTTLCSNENVVASIVSEDASIHDSYYPARWELDGGGGYGYYDYKTYTYSGLAPGKHVIGLQIVDKVGCYHPSNDIEINVKGPIAGYHLPGQIQCRGTEVTFTDNTDVSHSSGIKKWDWNWGDNTPVQSFTSGPFKHTYQQAGSYFVPSVTVTDKDGCVNTYNQQYLQVNGPNADFSADYYLIKPGDYVNLYNSSTETGGTIVSYKWDLGDGTTSNEAYYFSHQYPNKGIYPVKLQLTDDNGCTDEKTKSIKVSAVAAGFTYTSSFVNGSSCAPMLFRFTNTSTNFSSCEWDFGDGAISDQVSPNHTYVEAGHYKVTLKVKGDADTEDEYSEVMVVKGPYATIQTSAEGGCLEKEILFTIKPENATTFSWDFADGNVEQTTELEIKHHFTAPGIYKPRLILKDDAGCKGSALLDHPIVIDQLDIKLHPTPDKICDQGTLTFAPVFNSYSVEDLKIPPTFTWTYDASLTPKNITTTTPEFYLDKPGTYKFGMIASTKYGCAQTVDVPVNVYPKPLAAISGPDQVCKDVQISFSGSVTKATDVTWAWELGNGHTSSLQQPVAQLYDQPGAASIALTVTSAEGCADHIVHSLQVLALPDIKASTPSPFVCLGNTTQLHAGGGSTYEWTPALGLDHANIAEPKATPMTTTTYEVKVTDNNGCVNTDKVDLRVVQPFKILATPDTVLCLGDKLPLWATGADYYKWQGAGISQSTNAAPMATITATGNYPYEVTGYDKEGCFSDHTSLTVAVHPSPTVSVGPDREIMAGIPVYLRSVTSNDVVSWRWSPADGVDCPTCAQVQVLPNLTTRYQLEVTNRYGCKASDDATIHLLCNQSAIYMPNAFTPNQDGRNEFIYPKGKGVKEVAWLRIYDRWGTLVFENHHFPVNVPTAGWDGRRGSNRAPIGTYVFFMQTVCENGETFEFKGNITLIK
ncbi:PKD domain-containing protein [Chitinophaga sp. Ak27]|nr:PKD domain-containing protein [Chitinophaga sp. Ak27]